MDDSDHSTTKTTPASPAAPRPGWLLIGNSVVVIAVCTFFTSLGLAAFASMWDPCALASGSILFLLSVVIGLLQYRATFRRNPDSAGRVGIFFYVGGGFLLLSGVITLGEGFPTEIAAGELLPIFGPLFLIAVYGIWSGRLNRRWSHTLRAATLTDAARPEDQDAETPDHTLAPFQFSMRELFALVTVVAIILGLTSYFVQNTPPRFAEGVSPDKAPVSLPDGATDVTFCQGYRGTIAYEFSIDEKGFLEWAKSRGSPESRSANVPLKRLDGSSAVRITRCYNLSSQMPGPDYAEITHGYDYSWSEQDRGIHYAYDLETHRAYYYAHSH